jgi:Tol biopolymer transport system component
MPSLLADARGGVFIFPLPCPAEKGSGMTRRRTLHLAALPGTLAAAVLVACAVAPLAVSGEADAAFPGKNGRIAYNSGGVIYTIDPDRSAKTKVTNTRVSGYPIDYSPSGKTITYTSYEGFNDGKDTDPQKDAEIYTVNVGGGGRTNVTNNNRGDEASSYSPEGKRIAYTHWDGHDLEIYTINTDGTGELRVTDNRTNEFTPSYSPDGKKILFSGEERKVLRNDAVEIYTIGIHGKNRVQLTENATNDYFPDYSPDGRRIAYSGSGEKGTNIYTISARGGDKIKLTEGNDPDYSPDGKKIVYYTGNGPDGRIYTINVGGGGKSGVTEGSDPSWGIRP